MTETSHELLLLTLFLGLNSLLALAELALASSRKSKLKQLADAGSEPAKLAHELTEVPARSLTGIRLGVTLSSVLTGAYGGAVVAHLVYLWMLTHFPSQADNAGWISFIGVVVGITLVSLLFVELVPKRLALSHPERIALFFARPMHLFSRIVAPVVWALTAFTNGVSRIFGDHQNRPTPVTEEEVASLIEQGLSSGVFQKAESDMVQGVMALDKCPVTALMTPRPKMVWLNVDDPDEVNWRRIVASGHSHFPVYQQHRDNVLGMVSIKALWANAAFSLPTTLRNLVSPALIIPEKTMALQVLETFKKTGKHVALVADEFGGLQGLVTLNDVLEAIVGDLPDQMRRAQPEARRRDDGSWLVDATITIGELKTLIGVKALPGEKEADYQTVGGFVITQFGRIPVAGDYFDWSGWRFEVMDMDRQRVDKLLIRPTPAAAAEQKVSA